jgi:uncharacterized membrane protein
MRTPLILVSLLVLGLSLLSLLMPWYTRRDLFFGVTVQPEFRRTPPARRIVLGYRAGICSVLVVALSILLVMQSPVLALFIHILGTLVILIAAHHVASKYASPRDSAVTVDLSAPPDRMPGGVVAAFLPLAWLTGLGVWAALNTARLPSHVIIHWGMHGPDRWVATTQESAVLLVALPGLLCLVLAATAHGVLHWSRRISTSGPAAASERQFRRRFALLLLIVEYLIAVLPLFMLLAVPQAALRAWLIVLWITLIVFLIQLTRAGQGGSRSGGQTARAGQTAPVGDAAPVGDRTDDAYWLGGMIYVNPADHVLFVEKRMGIGWTLNFGNLWAWLLVLGVIAVPLMLRIALPPRSSSDTPEATVQAQAAALTWLASIDTGDYSQSWDTAATLFRNAVPEAQWVSRVSALRGHLGVLKGRSMSSARFRDTPTGEYVVIKYNSSFEHEAGATETVTPMMDADGKWHVSGYYIK